VSSVRAAVAALVVVAAACSSSPPPPVPEMPTFSVDVEPILLKNCVRCHGAGGTLNADPSSSLPYPPPNGYFDHYADQGNCTPDDAGVIPTDCKLGAASLAPAMKVYVNCDDLPMPPPPAARLSTHDRQVIGNWADEMPPLP